MTPQHRAPKRYQRRVFLGLAGLAAVPTGAVFMLQSRTQAPPAEATTGPSAAPSASPSASPSAAVTVPKIVTSGGGPVPFRRGRAMLGAYLGLDGLSPASAVDLRRRQLGRDLRILHVFYAWTDVLPRSIAWLPDDAYPMISWRGTDHASVLRGDHDALIARNAKQIRRFGRPVLLRWGWEMNGDWYAWGGADNGDNAAGYVKVWKRIRSIFADQGADNVSWVWSPNWNDSPAAKWNAKARYYPGDDQVDWVGVSGYNLHREAPGTMFQPIYDAYATRKPIMITEIGSVDRGGSTKADWITLAANWIEQHPAIGGVVWFDTDTHPGYHEKWRIDTDRESLAAFRAMARDAHFLG
ncbi:glycosyl hydrolase [Actinoplanes sp. NPDC051633]|uniref:glycoside hydrolase family 26 protein n=1 Tax=Actinoplanes sp. NPDC051633 TaxID=3155670 RepID=UPI003421C5E2